MLANKGCRPNPSARTGLSKTRERLANSPDLAGLRRPRHFEGDPDTVGVNAQIQSMMDDLETYMQLGPGTVKRETRAAEVAG